MVNQIVHVAAAVIERGDDHILLAMRPDDKHQGGLWEFPGGKLVAGESVHEALSRELKEELGILVVDSSPLIRIHHEYPDKNVLLDVWRVTGFAGEPYGCEGQEVRWVKRENLTHYEFPAANNPIVAAARLPDKYLVTGVFATEEELFRRLHSAMALGLRLVQFRAPWLESDAYMALAEIMAGVCRESGSTLMLKGDVSLLLEDWVDGIHLTADQLQRLRSKGWQYCGDKLLAASCHSDIELAWAAAIGCSFATLSPVHQTASHPYAKNLGKTLARAITDKAVIPVFWLGGMGEDDLGSIKVNGGQGMASISCWW
ncbi:Nudix family hydrolase [Kistimonas scapharcae]|uniref:8-oxo-dGTP diphosphatase n=1 Tax=Kistimonas scapharcae TaxID=1036133 RepID=A0ABP8UXS0_9GAMM